MSVDVREGHFAEARAFASRPQIVFADEPTDALDSKPGNELLTLLRKAVGDLGQSAAKVDVPKAVVTE